MTVEFLAEMDKQRRLQGKRLKDIAKETGLSYSVIRAFSCGSYRGDMEMVADRVAKCLGIER